MMDTLTLREIRALRAEFARFLEYYGKARQELPRVVVCPAEPIQPDIKSSTDDSWGRLGRWLQSCRPGLSLLATAPAKFLRRLRHKYHGGKPLREGRSTQPETSG